MDREKGERSIFLLQVKEQEVLQSFYTNSSCADVWELTNCTEVELWFCWCVLWIAIEGRMLLMTGCRLTESNMPPYSLREWSMLYFLTRWYWGGMVSLYSNVLAPSETIDSAELSQTTLSVLSPSQHQLMTVFKSIPTWCLSSHDQMYWPPSQQAI